MRVASQRHLGLPSIFWDEAGDGQGLYTRHRWPPCRQKIAIVPQRRQRVFNLQPASADIFPRCGSPTTPCSGVSTVEGMGGAELLKINSRGLLRCNACPWWRRTVGIRSICLPEGRAPAPPSSSRTNCAPTFLAMVRHARGLAWVVNTECFPLDWHLQVILKPKQWAS